MYSSNLSEVLTNLVENVLPSPAKRTLILQTVAHDLLSAIVTRIQQQGKNALSEQMFTKSPQKEGAYSERYGKKRIKKGLIVSHVNLTMEGNLIPDFQVLSFDEKEAVIGFLNDNQNEIATYLEDYYGQIFVASGEEMNIIIEQIYTLLRS